ncbi:MAG: hypothetical protein OER88_08895 [Planctomycetota bacterium]|nr:hypothetical protein [Planctomycetota bacterium]
MNDPRVIAAGDAFTRVRVRVPEAYLLLRPYQTTRPGLLVLDADGRRVASIGLPGMGAPPITSAEIATRLAAARTTRAVERWQVTVAGKAKALDTLATALRPAAISRAAATWTLRVAPGSLTPESLEKRARDLSVELTWHEPVPVRFTPKEGSAFDATLAAVAGVWHRNAATRRAFVSRGLLAPSRFPAGWSSDVEAKTFLLPGVPTGGTGARLAAAPTKVNGVLAIFADVFHERQVVVARKNGVDWSAVKRSFAAAGCEAKEAR